MSACTPIYGLPYPTSDDRGCDVGPVSCDFAEIVDAALSSVDAVVARTAATVPMVKVAATVPVICDTNTASSLPATFDTVLVDTNSMFTTDVDASLVTVNTSGLYLIMCSELCNTTGTPGNQLSIAPAAFIDPAANNWGGSTVVTQNVMATAGLGVYATAMGIFPLAAGTTIGLRLGPFCTGFDLITIFYSELAAIWLADL